MKITRPAADAIGYWSRDTADVAGAEQCGYLVLAGELLDDATPLANVHPQPGRGYAIDDRDLGVALLAAAQLGGELVVWHSHLDAPATPSTPDLEGAGVGNLLVIYSVLLDELRAYQVERSDDDRYRLRLRAVDVALEVT